MGRPVSSRDFRFACPGWPFIHPRAAEPTRLCSPHHRPGPNAVTPARADVSRAGGPCFQGIPSTPLLICVLALPSQIDAGMEPHRCHGPQHGRRAREGRRVVGISLFKQDVGNQRLLNVEERRATEQRDLEARPHRRTDPQLDMDRRLLSGGGGRSVDGAELLEMERMRQPRRDPGTAGGLEPGHADAEADLPPEAHARPEVDECPGVDTVIDPQVAVLPVERKRRAGRERGRRRLGAGIDRHAHARLRQADCGHRRHDDCDGRQDRDARPHAGGGR